MKYVYDYSKNRLEIKIKVLNHYSNNTLTCNCEYCNENNIKYLTIDHIKPNIKSNRYDKGDPIYRKLIKSDFPTGYQVLCYYCNSTKSNKYKCIHYLHPNNERLKKEIFNHYSNNNIKCICCGESNIHNLTIDHINGDGSNHRKSIKTSSGRRFYTWLKRNNFPKGYQILCIYCNLKKGKLKNCDCQTNPLFKII